MRVALYLEIPRYAGPTFPIDPRCTAIARMPTNASQFHKPSPASVQACISMGCVSHRISISLPVRARPQRSGSASRGLPQTDHVATTSVRCVPADLKHRRFGTVTFSSRFGCSKIQVRCAAASAGVFASPVWPGIDLAKDTCIDVSPPRRTAQARARVQFVRTDSLAGRRAYRKSSSGP